MKNYLKFVVAVVGITVATFGSISKANAKVAKDSISCKSYGTCGTSNSGATIEGQPY